MIVLYFIMAYGLSNLLVYGMGPWNILDKFRSFTKEHIPVVGDMLECMMCTPTNIGWILSLINIVLFPKVAFTPYNIWFNDTSLWYLIIPLDAFVTSGAVWLMHTLQEYFEKMVITEEDE